MEANGKRHVNYKSRERDIGNCLEGTTALEGAVIVQFVIYQSLNTDFASVVGGKNLNYATLLLVGSRPLFDHSLAGQATLVMLNGFIHAPLVNFFFSLPLQVFHHVVGSGKKTKREQSVAQERPLLHKLFVIDARPRHNQLDARDLEPHY